MAVPGLPKDFAAFLRSDSPRTLEAAHYGTITLIPLEQLQLETLMLTPDRGEDPHHHDYGYYPVPAVNLVLGSPRPGVDFPAWLLLWLPHEQRYGSFDLDHRD